MASELGDLVGKPLTTIHIDNGMRGRDQVFVWLAHLSGDDIAGLEKRWTGLHAPYQFEFSKIDTTLAASLGVAVPADAPAWDETFSGTYGEWLMLRESAEESLRRYNEELYAALDAKRASLLIDSGGALTEGLWLDGCYHFAFGYGSYGGAGDRPWLSVHGGKLYASTQEGTIDGNVFDTARLAGDVAFWEAHAANVGGVSAMDVEDLIDLGIDGVLGVESDGTPAQDLLYSAWVRRAEAIRAHLLKRLANGKDSELEDEVVGGGLSFIISPEEARESAERSVLGRFNTYAVPPEVVESLLGLLGREVTQVPVVVEPVSVGEADSPPGRMRRRFKR